MCNVCFIYRISSFNLSIECCIGRYVDVLRCSGHGHSFLHSSFLPLTTQQLSVHRCRQAAFTGVVLHMSPIPGDQETPRVRIRVWSITEQWRHPPSMSAGAGLGAESVLASVLGRTDRRCRSLHTPGHCTLGLSSAIRSLHFLAVNMTQNYSSDEGQQLDVNVTNMFPEKYFYSIVFPLFPTVQCPAEIH